MSKLQQVFLWSAVLVSILSLDSLLYAQRKVGGKIMQLTSNSFKDGGSIPTRFTCEGENISPHLAWTNVPFSVQSFALTCLDPDAPAKTWIHWIIFNIPASVNFLASGVKITDPMKEGVNDFKKTSYGGPCPPKGHGRHRYQFTLYALDQFLNLSSGATLDQLQGAMQEKILAQAQLIGIYERK